MSGTIIVSMGDSESKSNAVAKNPLLGDILSLVSAALYAVYITLIRKKLPDDDERNGRVSMAQFLGFLGLFNFFIFLPPALILNFTKRERFNALTLKQFGLVVGKGMQTPSLISAIVSLKLLVNKSHFLISMGIDGTSSKLGLM